MSGEHHNNHHSLRIEAVVDIAARARGGGGVNRERLKAVEYRLKGVKTASGLEFEA